VIGLRLRVPAPPGFFGWRVVSAAFLVAAFGYGVGFYGPPVYMYAVQQAHGWPIELVSAAVTTHSLVAAALVANLPALHRRLGLGLTTKAGAVALALGVLGWSLARQPWMLFAATLVSGAGWGTVGGATINAIVSPWFRRRRPKALSLAMNGASMGGIVFSPLWVFTVTALGFPSAALLIGLATVAALWVLCDRYVARTPEQLALVPDGEAPAQSASPAVDAIASPGHHPTFWRDWRFLTLVGGMAIGYFVQGGLIAHLFSLLLPALGARRAGLAVGFATLCAMGGRTLVGWFLPAGANRRTVSAANYCLQAFGCVAFVLSGGTNVGLLLAGVVLVGLGIGNTTSLPPLIAQAEFSDRDILRVVAWITAISQASYAFSPAVFGELRAVAGVSDAVPVVFVAAAAIYLTAAGCYLAGVLHKTYASGSSEGHRPGTDVAANHSGEHR
jgi:MFS family permease